MNDTRSIPEKITLPTDGNATGRWLGEEELELLRQVIESGTLNDTRGTMVRRLEREFAQLYDVPHCVAANSGTAAVHTAIAALDLPRGSSVVTTPITDMGAITPILYEGLTPVFADVDPETGNVTAETIGAALTPETRAVIVTHLFGRPCEMGPIVGLLQERGIPLVEDCAQAYLAEWGGRRAGTFGDIAAFSMQQGKHMTCGEGGMVITGDDGLADRARLFVNKSWPYGKPNPDHMFPALNYRLSELQGAVAVAQLQKLDRNVRTRQGTAAQLTEALSDVPGLTLPRPPAEGTHVYWRYCLGLDPEVAGDVAEVGGRLQGRGVACAPRYIQKPAFECKVLRDALPAAPDPERFAGTYRMLRRALVLPWNEAYGAEQVAQIDREIRRALAGS
ncbi:MAG: DegT/DnrJ/EryC1/StrS family aminotransferase [Acidobacteriota bacterium]|jgi:dTDP-4-amino-4,6-dideoxygalactose transaminase